MITLSRAKTPKIAREAVAMYLAHPYGADPVTVTDEATAVRNLQRCFADTSFVFLAAHVKDEFAAWLLAKVGPANLHSSDVALSQLYYVSSAEGYRAARLLYACHDALYEEAVKRNVDVIVSGQSHMDAGGTLVRLLARRGWDTAGHLAYRRIATQTRPSRRTMTTPTGQNQAHSGPL